MIALLINIKVMDIVQVKITNQGMLHSLKVGQLNIVLIQKKNIGQRIIR